MKKIFVALAMLTSLGSSYALTNTVASSMDCNRTFDKPLCPGDFVMSSSGYAGKVVGINTINKTAAVKWTLTNIGTSTSHTSTLKIRELSIGRGCLNDYCVGDEVVENDGSQGIIKAINPYNGLATVSWEIDNYGRSVIGSYSVSIKDLSIGRGCVIGYCVGDIVFNKDGWKGQIIGVNRFNNQAAVSWSLDEYGIGIISYSTDRISDLSTAEYCSTYDDAHRVVPYSITRSQYQSSKPIGGFEEEFYID